MTDKEKFNSPLKLKSEGLSSLFFVSLLILILLAGLLYFSLIHMGLVFSISIPFIILLALWLIIYLPFKLYLFATRSVDTIIFSASGITFINKKVNILESYSWKNIIHLMITKYDTFAKPVEITIYFHDKESTINLKLYHTIFTSTDVLWGKISAISEFYISENTKETPLKQ